ncbi:MAG: O-antigen ligase family protein [Gracilibacteraceae bacterium]|jgi:O-antigen ligase|nr:O-antigen ligase family protein [Gracilibacteraceae bacterium]
MFWCSYYKNETRIFLLLTVILSAMLLPAFSLHPALPSLRLDEFVLFSGFGLYAARFVLDALRRRERPEPPPGREWLRATAGRLFAALVASYAVSNLYAVIFLDAAYTRRDAMELVMYFKYFLIITLVCSIELTAADRLFLRLTASFALALLLVFGWGQHWNLLGLDAWLAPFFNQAHWEHLILGNPARILGAFDNPNVFGLFTVLALALLVTHYYFADDKGKFPLLLLAAIGLVIKLEYLTISRTALMGIAILFALTSAWAWTHFQRNRRVTLKILALFLLTLILFFTSSADFLSRVAEGLDFSNSTSLQGHLARWNTAIGSIWDSPVFGWGTQKTAMTTLVDNEYALYTRRYGFIGLAAYLAVFLLPLTVALRLLRGRPLGRKKAAAAAFTVAPVERGRPFTGAQIFLAAYVSVLPSVLLYNFMAGIFYHLQLMTSFCLLMGGVYALGARAAARKT